MLSIAMVDRNKEKKKLSNSYRILKFTHGYINTERRTGLRGIDEFELTTWLGESK